MSDNQTLKPVRRIGILISGRGSNMVALAEAVSASQISGAAIEIVVSDQRDAGGLKRAEELGLRTTVIERAGRTRDEHEREIIAALTENKVNLVCLAGFMILLSANFIQMFSGRILNIHPSLLPCFPGRDAQQQTINHGVKWSGCTVHFVDETLDGGPIIAQRIVPVMDDDTVESLSARILIEEHKLYPEAVALVVSEKYEVIGRRVVRKD